MAFYVITQGPFYRNGICQINFGNTFFIFIICAFCWYKFLPHLQQPRNERKEKKAGTDQTIGLYKSLQAPRNLQSRL